MKSMSITVPPATTEWSVGYRGLPFEVGEEDTQTNKFQKKKTISSRLKQPKEGAISQTSGHAPVLLIRGKSSSTTAT